jgi:S1-C subfamily serine protease
MTSRAINRTCVLLLIGSALVEARFTRAQETPPIPSAKRESIQAELESMPTIDLGMELRDTANGLVVGEVIPGGFGVRSGFKAGDIILSGGEQAVGNLASLEQLLRGYVAGEQVIVAVERNGSIQKLTLTMPANLLAKTAETSTALSTEGQAAAAATGEASIEPGGQPTEGSYRGVELPFVDLGWSLRNTPNGVLIIEIRKGPLSKDELKAGDVILGIDKNRVASPAAVNYELHRHKAEAIVEFELIRENRRVVKRVRLPQTHQALLLDAPPASAPADPSEEADLTPEEAAAVRALFDEIKELRAQIAELRKLREIEAGVVGGAGESSEPLVPGSPLPSQPN